MNFISLLYLIAKFLIVSLPRLIEEYKKAQADTRYENEAARIDAAVKSFHTSTGRGKLDAARELEK